ncbi:MAG: UDP-N-acetylmuramate:L-alanyl-gamma-D-glutamyl-meso-diaminopimelate ligase [Gammaproteobacteria bacterium]|nr:UDP-N-acetylmuramate:L-alanyl-gamma-D-glutamyl-meso-diaminopimelate ligase [Gammaproteobacteria bacterium]
MKIHILGICGTFMGGIALLARALGHEVSGSDANVYPPMSTQLAEQGIELMEGYVPEHLQPAPDLVIVGNTLSRGNPAVEFILNNKLPHISGPQWLSEHILHTRHVLAVSGTHGKTTTTGMLCWILESAGLNPGFLVGGVPQNFGISASMGGDEYFVVEADEYDTAFFDKRSKFIHYHPDTLIINNIEYDHADIFADIAAIRREFHHMVRIVPGNGLIIAKQGDAQVSQTLKMGCWSAVQYFGEQIGDQANDMKSDWSVDALADDFSQFNVLHHSRIVGKVSWELIGQFNAENALAAIAAANHVGVEPAQACEALQSLKNIKRRLECLAEVNQVTIYDDFAHHPTAIRASLKALRQKVKNQRIIAIMEPRSNTMRQGIHKETLADAFIDADQIYLYAADNLDWDLSKATSSLGEKVKVMQSIDDIVSKVVDLAEAGDYILIMSNGSFSGIQQKLIENL